MKIYRQSEYVMFAESELIVFHVGRKTASLTRHLKGRDAFLITAWDPYSKPQSIAKNRAANKRLVRDLRRTCDEVWCAQGRKKDYTFFEDSFVGIGITREKAIALGRKYRQNAIVYMSPRAEVIWTAD